MARYKTKLDKFDWSDMVADTDPTTGKRVYYTPDGPAPSVTTILSTLPHPELDEWRIRVGEEEADRISKEATTIGTYMHDMLEAHLKQTEFPYDGSELEAIAKPMAKAIRLYGWKRLQEVWAIEIPLHFGDLYAGRTDLIGLHANKPTVMDYKTSKYIKPPSHLTNYRLQIAMYALALEKMFGMRFDDGINFFSIRPVPEMNRAAAFHNVAMDKTMMDEYKRKAVEVVFEYYENTQTWTDSRIANMDLLIDMANA